MRPINNRGLYMKLVLILLLLIVSLMTVVSAFIIRGVTGFYLDEFYEQMQMVFSGEQFVRDLRSAADEEDGEERIDSILNAYSGFMGIDFITRNYYVLDGESGQLLASSDNAENAEITPNIVTALTGENGYASNNTASYMDVAVPIEGRERSYVISVRDNKLTVRELTNEIIFIIIEALIIGLIISILLAFLLAKTMVIPIQSLTRAANRVAAGDFSQRIEVQAKDEIGVLTRSFNNMADRLHNTLLDIENERNKLSTVFLHMSDGIVACSADGEIIHFNPAAERMLGIDFIGTALTFDDIFGDIASLEKVMGMKSTEVIEGERSIMQRNLEIFIAPFFGEGAPGGILAVIHDVTEQRRSDELRREFVANVSHELRTPITNIRSYAETLVDAGGELPKETENDFLGVILSESDRMTKLVQDLLALSRYDAGEMEFKTEIFNTCESAKSVYEAMRLDAAKHDLKLSIELPAYAVTVDGDRARIEQVIMNIVSNSVRYTPKDGSIVLRVWKEGREAKISVSDTGIGIPPEDMPRIFDRFYRVDKARSRSQGGTGLGLSIAAEIIRRHNGRIDVESEPGRGTVMTVVLPSAEAAFT